MENKIPMPLQAARDSKSGSVAQDSTDSSIADQAVDRSLEARRATARAEIEKLVSAALIVIERTGNLEPKVSDILAEAGLSNQAFYRHFRGKHELLAAVLDRGIRELASYLTRRMASAESPSDAVREWIRGLVAQAQSPIGARATRPFALARGRLAESVPETVSRTQTLVTAPLREALAAARASGAMPAVDSERDAEALYHLMMGWLEARLLELQTPDPAEGARLESFVMAGLGRALAAADETEAPQPEPSETRASSTNRNQAEGETPQ